MTKTTKTLVYGDLVMCAMHGRIVRFVRYEGDNVVIADRNTMVELPDWSHTALLTVC